MFPLHLFVGRFDDRSERRTFRETPKGAEQNDSRRYIEDHVRRSRALHDILDEDRFWAVSDCGKTDDALPYDYVELWMELKNGAPQFAPLDIPALVYVGKILTDSGLSIVVVEGVKQLLAKCRNKQDERQIGSASINFLDDEATVDCSQSGNVSIGLRTFVRVPYKAVYGEVSGLGPTATEAIDVPTSLVPFVREMIFKNYGRRPE